MKSIAGKWSLLWLDSMAFLRFLLKKGEHQTCWMWKWHTDLKVLHAIMSMTFNILTYRNTLHSFETQKLSRMPKNILQSTHAWLPLFPLHMESEFVWNFGVLHTVICSFADISTEVHWNGNVIA